MVLVSSNGKTLDGGNASSSLATRTLDYNGDYMIQKSELTIDLRIKTIAHHDENDDLEKLCNKTFEEIQAICSVPAESWEILGYKIESLESDKNEKCSINSDDCCTT